MLLTRVEREFVQRLGMSEDDVLDGRQLSQTEIRDAARSQGKLLIIGSECAKSRHRLRTPYGHCAQCDTSKLGYVKRYSISAYVYLARSSSENLFKIGLTESVEQRVRQLNFERYGGAADWRVLRSARAENAGKVEHHAHSLLRSHAVSAQYTKNGRTQEASELFRCDPDTALKAFEAALKWASGHLVSKAATGSTRSRKDAAANKQTKTVSPAATSVIVECGNCSQRVRLILERKGSPKCPRCHTPLRP
jgi:hypothetical protein